MVVLGFVDKGYRSSNVNLSYIGAPPFWVAGISSTSYPLKEIISFPVKAKLWFDNPSPPNSNLSNGEVPTAEL